MDRLTKWFRNAKVAYVARTQLHGQILREAYNLDEDDTTDIQETLDRLAAYEDTGLSPEEVALYVKCNASQMSKQELQLGIESDRLREEVASLQSQLAESQRRERIAVEDLERFGHNIHTCRNAEICVPGTNDHSACCDCPYWQWRGPQEAGEGVE